MKLFASEEHLIAIKHGGPDDTAAFTKLINAGKTLAIEAYNPH